jgi:hypothetical protein
MKQATRRKHHYIYKITRADGSGKYYIGMHSTDDLEDGYFGSGSILSKSIKKHGKDKHHKEILEYLPSREALKLREKELVNEELLSDKLCMNIVQGGHGGADVGRLGGKALKTKRDDNVFDVALRAAMSAGAKKRFDNQEQRSMMSSSTKAQWVTSRSDMFERTQAGQRRYREADPVAFSEKQGKRTKGKIWITNGTVNRMVLPENKPVDWKLGRC